MLVQEPTDVQAPAPLQDTALSALNSWPAGLTWFWEVQDVPL